MIEEINNQLVKADIRKKLLINKIYKEYELYLQIVRKLIYPSVEKGIRRLCSNLSMSNIFLSEKEFGLFLEKKINNIINSHIPFLTIEQLKIREIEFTNQNLTNNTSIDIEQNKGCQINSSFDYDFISEESLKFNINEKIDNDYKFYQTYKSDNLKSLDFDKNNQFDDSQNSNPNEKMDIEKQFFSSLLELLEEDNLVQINGFENLKGKNGVNYQNIDLDRFDLIDNSLSKLLKNFSYKVNLELYKSNLIKKIISEKSFNFLTDKKFMMKNPHPFVINFDLNNNQSQKNVSKLPSIFLFNITTVELEFKNLNLSIQRNQINELKSQFQVLIKKEKYWRQKEINLNKMNRKK